MDPFSVFVTKSNTNVDQVSVSFLLSRSDFNKFNSKSKIPLFKQNVGKLTGKFEPVLVMLSAEEFACESIGYVLRVLFIFLRNVLLNNCLKGGHGRDSLEGLRGKSCE